MKKELQRLKESPEAEIYQESLKATLKKVAIWKTPGHNGICEFWFKEFTSIHDRLALELSRCLEGANIPEWMIKEKTTKIKKDPRKGTISSNYRPITCLPIKWKIITAQINTEVYYSLVSHGLFPKGQKGYQKGTGYLLYIDQYIFKESKEWRKNVAMT